MSVQRIAVLGALFVLALMPCAAQAGLTDMLMVVANPASLTTQEIYRQSGFQGGGYTVTLIDDNASQASFDAALVGKNIAYVPITVVAASLGTKLKNTTVGVVNENPSLADEFGFSDSTFAIASKNFIAIQSVTNYVTYGYSGNLTILTAARNLARRTGTLAAGISTLANVESSTAGTFNPGVLVLSVGAALHGGGAAAGRRVLLPVGDTAFDVTLLNTAGQALFLHAVEWAARPNPAIGDLLLVVTSTSTPTSQETMRRLLIDTWGYNVTQIASTDTQTNFNTAIAANDVAYISEEISSSDVGTKLTSASIGVLNEEINSVDEFKFSSSFGSTTATAITISNNTHYITSPFATGSLTLFTSSQPVDYVSGTLAPGLQTLGQYGTSRALVVLEAGSAGQGSGNAAGRRVEMPWGGGAFDFATLNTAAKTLMRRAIEWGAAPPGTRVLLVAADSGSLSSQETARITLFESWGYSVTLIDDGASQTDFNSAVAGVNVAYVSEEVDSGTLGTKLKGVGIGVLNEEPAATDEFGFSTSSVVGSGTALSITSNTHYITSPFSVGSLTIFSTSQETASLAGTIAADAKHLATWGTDKTLVAIEAGGKLSDGTSAAGRRVQLPWGGGNFDFTRLTANGQTLLQRAIQWASGLIGYWKLDETSGTTASDASGHSHTGTLTGGITFASDSVAGKLSTALDFNGSTDYITIANTSLLQPTAAMTVSAWIKGDSWGAGSDADTILRKGEGNPNNYQLCIADGRVQLALDGNDGSDYRGNTVLQTGTWYHVAATWDGTTVRVYVNGVLDRTPPQTKAAPIAVDTRPLYIGGRSGADLFDGVIDDVRLYNYALTSDEITTLRGTGQPKGVRVLKWVEIQ